jgi:hypothetical protein
MSYPHVALAVATDRVDNMLSYARERERSYCLRYLRRAATDPAILRRRRRTRRPGLQPQCVPQ